MWISAKFQITVIRAYDSLVNPVQYGLKDLPTATPKTLTPAMQRQVQKAIGKLVKNQIGTTYAGLYGQIKDKFDVGSYKDVPFKRYGELCEFLNIQPIEGELVEPAKLEYQPPKGMALISIEQLADLQRQTLPLQLVDLKFFVEQSGGLVLSKSEVEKMKGVLKAMFGRHLKMCYQAHRC